jgi:hypothetical protein
MWSKIQSKIQNIVRRAYITLTNNDNKQFSYTQANAMNKTLDIETIYPYGLFAQAPTNSLALIFSVQGNEENLAGICYPGSTRFKNLKEGEVLLGNTLAQTYIKLDKDGNVEIDSKAGITVTAVGTITINAPTVILGDPGSAKNIARLDDQIKVTVDGVEYIGTIISAGNNKSS